MSSILSGHFLHPIEMEQEVQEVADTDVSLLGYLSVFRLVFKTWRARKVERRIDAYTFEPLIHHMIDSCGWTEDAARQTFTSLKDFYKEAYWESESPSKEVDEMWHNHILFTCEYAHFCKRVYGGFLHHRPRGRA